MIDRDCDEALYNQQKDWEAEQEFYASESAKAEADIKAQEENEMAMTEQELIESLGRAITQPDWHGIVEYTNKTGNFDRINEAEDKVVSQIFALIKEAGYVKLDLKEGERPAVILKPKKRPNLIIGGD